MINPAAFPNDNFAILAHVDAGVGERSVVFFVDDEAVYGQIWALGVRNPLGIDQAPDGRILACGLEPGSVQGIPVILERAK